MKYEIYSSKYFGVEPEPVNPKFIEMDKNMQKGYGYEFEEELIKAVNSWHIVFTKLKTYFKEYKLENLKEFDEIFNGNQYVSNWIQDYDDALRDTLIKCSDNEKQIYGKQKIELLTFLLEINSSDEFSYLKNLRSLAETYYLLGNFNKGELLFQVMIREYPDHAWGYIGYSDQYWLENNNKNYDKALKILLDAYNRITVEDRDVIIERLTALKTAIKKKELEEC